jgi:hypothetical protein
MMDWVLREIRERRRRAWENRSVEKRLRHWRKWSAREIEFQRHRRSNNVFFSGVREEKQ